MNTDIPFKSLLTAKSQDAAKQLTKEQEQCKAETQELTLKLKENQEANARKFLEQNQTIVNKLRNINPSQLEGETLDPKTIQVLVIARLLIAKHSGKTNVQEGDFSEGISFTNPLSLLKDSHNIKEGLLPLFNTFTIQARSGLFTRTIQGNQLQKSGSKIPNGKSVLIDFINKPTSYVGTVKNNEGKEEKHLFIRLRNIGRKNVAKQGIFVSVAFLKSSISEEKYDALIQKSCGEIASETPKQSQPKVIPTSPNQAEKQPPEEAVETTKSTSPITPETSTTTEEASQTSNETITGILAQAQPARKGNIDTHTPKAPGRIPLPKTPALPTPGPNPELSRQIHEPLQSNQETEQWLEEQAAADKAQEQAAADKAQEQAERDAIKLEDIDYTNFKEALKLVTKKFINNFDKAFAELQKEVLDIHEETFENRNSNQEIHSLHNIIVSTLSLQAEQKAKVLEAIHNSVLEDDAEYFFSKITDFLPKGSIIAKSTQAKLIEKFANLIADNDLNTTTINKTLQVLSASKDGKQHLSKITASLSKIDLEEHAMDLNPVILHLIPIASIQAYFQTLDDANKITFLQQYTQYSGQSFYGNSSKKNGFSINPSNERTVKQNLKSLLSITTMDKPIYSAFRFGPLVEHNKIITTFFTKSQDYAGAFEVRDEVADFIEETIPRSDRSIIYFEKDIKKFQTIQKLIQKYIELKASL